MLNTSSEFKTASWSSWNHYVGDRFSVIGGQEYTASAYLKASTTQAETIRIFFYNSSGGLTESPNGTLVNAGSEGYSVLVAKAPADAVSAIFVLRHISASPSQVTVQYKEVMVAKGNKATDWTPAPEDQVSDWSETNVNSFAFLKNKPTTFATLGLTDNAGSAIQPVYFSGGKPSASNATVGGTTTPMYLKAGVMTALGYTIAKSVPSGAKFTDENVKYTLAADNQEYRMLMSEYYSTAPTTLGIKYTDNIRINPYLSKITATTFSGDLTGNVSGSAGSTAN